MIDAMQYKLTWDHFEELHEDKRMMFEYLCRSLFYRSFCKEEQLHSNPNNPGIETEPCLAKDNKTKIAFQAKYFDGEIDYSQIKKSIETMIRHYKDRIDCVYLFCNKGGDKMKRILNVFLSFVIIMSFLIVPTYADGFDTPVDPIDPEEYVEINCSGSNSGEVSLNDTSHSRFTIWVSFSGYYRKQTSTSLPYYYNITATRTGYNNITGVGTPFISSTSYYVSNGKVWCTLTISNNLGTGTVDMSVCDYH